jgi:RNA methyltransferase, TrmH family
MLVKSKVKYIQTLGQKKLREKEGLFVAEGSKLVNELLVVKEIEVVEVFAVKEWLISNPQLVKKHTVTEITTIDLEKISQLTTPNQVLAIIKQFDTAVLPNTTACFTIALDNIQDPGNLGTIIRIADWFGIRQIICSHESADVYNSKVVQSTMGSIARVKVFYTDLKKWLSEIDSPTICAATLDGLDVTKINKLSEGILLIGNESKGISPEIMTLANTRITIPGRGQAESLNAAVATGIILSHLVK